MTRRWTSQASCSRSSDGDARGGAALSVTAVTGQAIKFAGIGEKLDQIEAFHPDRMAGRILGMGDVLTLIEKAEQNLDEKKAAEMADKLRQNKFTLADYLEQMKQLKGMGSMEDIAGMLGMNAKSLKGAKVDEKAMARTEAIILSMTPKERENPGILGNSRKKRIAAGSGIQRRGGQPPAQAVRHDAPAGEADVRQQPQDEKIRQDGRNARDARHGRLPRDVRPVMTVKAA